MNSTYKKIINTILVSLFLVVLMPVAAQASCSVSGVIVRVTQYDDSYTSTGCYIYMRSNGPLTSYYHYTKTNDDNTCTNAAIAVTSSVDVRVNGSATSCPASGSSRYMGLVNYLIINP